MAATKHFHAMAEAMPIVFTPESAVKEVTYQLLEDLGAAYVTASKHWNALHLATSRKSAD